MLQILDLEITSTYQNYKQQLENFMSNFGSQNMDIAYKEISTRQGKTVYKTEIKNHDNNDTFGIIAEKNGSTGDISLRPLEFTNMSSGYYEYHISDKDNEGTPEDPAYAYCSFLHQFATTVKGTVAYFTGDGLAIVHEGTKKPGKIAAVDNSGNLYGARDVKKLSAGGENDFTINRPLNEWLADVDQLLLQTKLQTVPDPQDKADLIGKYLIMKKQRGDIDFDEFYDIFRQPGMLRGYKDAMLTSIYQLLM